MVSVDNCSTRLRLDVKDSGLVDETALKQHVAGIIKPNKTALQVVIDPHVEFIANELKKLV